MMMLAIATSSMKSLFQIQPDSEIPASTQLLNQISFAIASRQFLPGHQLPSTRQLAMQTGLHRNTISKVYRQLEELGLVEAQAGSGIYVRSLGQQAKERLAHFNKYPQACELVQKSLDKLLSQGSSLDQARELFLAEIEWRLRCSMVVYVTAPLSDLGVGELMRQELERALGIPVQLVPLEQLGQALEKGSGTVVTNRYFAEQTEAVTAAYAARVIPVDINQFAQELQLVKTMPTDSCLGVVSLSSGILRVVEVICHSIRGEEILVLTAQLEDTVKLRSIIRSAHTIICERAILDALKATIQKMRDDLVRVPQVLCSESYINAESIDLLKRELGLP
jgi:GntR family transcriptional regulator